MQIGEIQVEMLSDGTMRNDGGGFFGTVPKVLWERAMPPDERNRVNLRLNCVLIRAEGKNILVDSGVGAKHNEKTQRIFHLDTGHLVADLARHGLAPEEIDAVAFSHLHFDHAGGATHRDAAGALRVTFPRAQHLVQRTDWDEATHPNPRSAGGYFEQDFAPLRQANQLELLDGDTQIAPGVWCRVTGGHTAGHQIVTLEVAGRTACFFGDLIPTPHHLPVHYTQAYDLFPLDVMSKKRELLARAVQEQWLVLFDHEPEHPVGYVTQREDGRFGWKAAEA